MNCPKCGHELSDRATMCPYCGADWNSESDKAQGTHHYCIHCGQELPESAKFCPKCGAQRAEGKAATSPSSSSGGTDSSGRAQDVSHSDSKSSGQNRGLIKLLLVIGMVCFIFPFATVSCGDITASVSGLEAMTSLTMQDNLDVYVSDRAPNLFLILAFVLGIVAVYKTQAKSIKGTAATATVGTVCLLLFRTSFVSYYDLGDYINLVTLEFRWGWILSILTYAVAAVLSWLHHLQEKNVTGQVVHTETVSSSQTPPPQEPSAAPPYEVANTEEDKEE